MYQTAMKMNVLSPVNFNVRDADSLHLLEGNTNDVAMARHHSVSRGLRQWYGTERELQELGRSGLFPSRISAANPERGERAEHRPEVGLPHSRGVAVVMRREGYAHSKGATLLCRGKGTHVPTNEQGKTC